MSSITSIHLTLPKRELEYIPVYRQVTPSKKWDHVFMMPICKRSHWHTLLCLIRFGQIKVKKVKNEMLASQRQARHPVVKNQDQSSSESAQTGLCVWQYRHVEVEHEKNRTSTQFCQPDGILNNQSGYALCKNACSSPIQPSCVACNQSAII